MIFTTILRKILLSYENIGNAQEYLLPKLEKINQTGYNQEKAMKWQVPGSQSQWWEISLPKSPHSSLKSNWQLTRDVQTSRDNIMSKSTVYRTSTKTEQKTTFQLRKSLMDSIFGRFQRCIDACGEIIGRLSPISKQFLKLSIHSFFVVFAFTFWAEVKAASFS